MLAAFGLFVAGIAVSEVVARVALKLAPLELPPAEVQQGQEAGVSEYDWRAQHVPHPFLGFVRNPTQADVNELGFYGPSPVGADCAPEGLLVGVTGGSFAAQLVAFSGEDLRVELERTTSRPVCLFNVAMGGFKQPQQLATITYFSFLGVDFDLVLNIDGHNEIKQGFDNRLAGVAVAYPGLWLYHARSLAAARIPGPIARRALWQERMAWTEEVGRHAWLALFRLGGLVAHRVCTVRLAQAEREVQQSLQAATAAGSLEWWVSGGAPAEAEEVGAEITEQWRRASREIARHQWAKGGAYLHFLQPNQYVDRGKPLSEEEQRLALTDVERAKRLRAVYPMLREAGRQLESDGIPFRDLTGVLTGHSETLWRDACCHLNTTGYAIVAAGIGEEVRTRWPELERRRGTG